VEAPVRASSRRPSALVLLRRAGIQYAFLAAVAAVGLTATVCAAVLQRQRQRNQPNICLRY